jgi:hypothetical protein
VKCVRYEGSRATQANAGVARGRSVGHAGVGRADVGSGGSGGGVGSVGRADGHGGTTGSVGWTDERAVSWLGRACLGQGGLGD